MVHTKTRVVADLVYDTQLQPLSAGIRAVMQRARRLLFATGDTELELQVSPDREADRRKVTGNLLNEGEAVEGATVRVLGQTRTDEDQTDEDGMFRLTILATGGFSLEIETLTQVIDVGPLAAT